MVKKYRDVIRMTLFGRHDKNINDAGAPIPRYGDIPVKYNRKMAIKVPN